MLDDSIPSAYLSEMDQGIYGGVLGDDVKFMCDPTTGWISSMVFPFLNDLAEWNKLALARSSKWYKRYINQLEIFAREASTKFGISHFTLIDGLNFIFELIGATKTYLSLIDEPELVRKVVDFAYDLNVEIQNDFFKRIPLLENGTCSGMAQWIPPDFLSLASSLSEE